MTIFVVVMNNIRRATAVDLSQIYDCANLAYHRYVERIGKKPAPMEADFKSQVDQGIVYVFVLKKDIVGFVVFYPDGNNIHLENVAVKPKWSGQGIGKLLIQFVEQYALKKGYKVVELYTNEVMTENLDMYPRLGYVEIERKRQAGFNRVFYRKVV